MPCKRGTAATSHPALFAFICGHLRSFALPSCFQPPAAGLSPCVGWPGLHAGFRQNRCTRTERPRVAPASYARLTRRSRNQKGKACPVAVRANSDDPPFHIRPMAPASAGAKGKNPVGSGHYGTPSIAPRAGDLPCRPARHWPRPPAPRLGARERRRRARRDGQEQGGPRNGVCNAVARVGAGSGGESVRPVRIVAGVLNAEFAETQSSQRNSIEPAIHRGAERHRGPPGRRAWHVPDPPASTDQQSFLCALCVSANSAFNMPAANIRRPHEVNPSATTYPHNPPRHAHKGTRSHPDRPHHRPRHQAAPNARPRPARDGLSPLPLLGIATRQPEFQREVPLAVIYEDIRLNQGYFADIIVAQTVLLELKSVERILPVHEAQTRTYVRLSGCKVGLLMNFNAALLKDGLRRFIP